METDGEQLARWLSALRNGTLPVSEQYHVLHEIGRAEYLPARSDVEQFLSDDDPQLRYVALEVLTRHFRLGEHWDTARRFLETDRDIDCRQMGASALATLARASADRPTLQVLARVVRDAAEQAAVRQTAYRAMLRVLHGDTPQQFHMAARRIDLNRDVDWKLVDSFLQ